jgi:O-acetyl-ADP-ribose deacetylase (regulator of RNase III)
MLSETTNASFAAGDLLDAPADAICNPVNLVGVMGRGLALQFRRRWPESYRAYRAALQSGELRHGTVHAHRLPNGRHVLHCPTKHHWRDPSPITLVQATIDEIGPCCARHGIRSVAVPPLGCGLGGLEWAGVRALLLAAAARDTRLRWLLYEARARVTRTA